MKWNEMKWNEWIDMYDWCWTGVVSRTSAGWRFASDPQAESASVTARKVVASGLQRKSRAFHRRIRRRCRRRWRSWMFPTGRNLRTDSARRRCVGVAPLFGCGNGRKRFDVETQAAPPQAQSSVVTNGRYLALQSTNYFNCIFENTFLTIQFIIFNFNSFVNNQSNSTHYIRNNWISHNQSIIINQLIIINQSIIN